MRFLFGSTPDPSTVNPGSMLLWCFVKLIVIGSISYYFVCYSYGPVVHSTSISANDGDDKEISYPHRRLQETRAIGTIPSYMQPMIKDLEDRKTLFQEAPPEEVKYWFEYTGPLQVSQLRLVEGDLLQQTDLA